MQKITKHLEYFDPDNTFVYYYFSERAYRPIRIIAHDVVEPRGLVVLDNGNIVVTE